MQAVAPGEPAKEPVAHAAHDVVMVVLAYVPGLHCWQGTTTLLLYWPGVHDVQAVA